MNEIYIRFPCGSLMLEGKFGLPEGKGPLPAVVICHPHPLYGGSMDNNVVYSIYCALIEASISSFRFNFRGVGGSEGKYDRGNGEQQDVYSAIDFVAARDEVDPDRIGLVGYSAGSGYSLLTGIRDNRVKSIVAVSTPLTLFDFSPLRDCLKPKLIISGGMDEHTPVDRFIDFCQSIPQPSEHYIIDSADHFWWGNESKLGERVAGYFLDIFNDSGKNSLRSLPQGSTQTESNTCYYSDMPELL